MMLCFYIIGADTVFNARFLQFKHQKHEFLNQN